MCGVALVCWGDAAATESLSLGLVQSSRTLGNLMAIMAALGYASFLTYYRTRMEGVPVSCVQIFSVRSDCAVDDVPRLPLFFGLVGATSLIVYTPILVAFNYQDGVPIPGSSTVVLCLAGDVAFSFAAGSCHLTSEGNSPLILFFRLFERYGDDEDIGAGRNSCHHAHLATVAPGRPRSWNRTRGVEDVAWSLVSDL